MQVHTEGGLALDFLAFGLSLALTGLLILGTHETSLFNLGGHITPMHICLPQMQTRNIDCRGDLYLCNMTWDCSGLCAHGSHIDKLRQKLSKN